MGYLLKSGNTTRSLLFLMVDSSDHLTGKAGLSPTVTISKNGAAFASPAGAVSEVGSGWYKVAANATDADTVGPLLLHATAATADPTDDRFEVVSFDPDTMATQTGDAYTRLGAPAGASLAADVAAVKVDTAAILADTGTDGVVVASASKTGYALSAAGVDAIWDEALAGHATAGTAGKGVSDLLTNLGTPVSLDGGTASLAGMLTKLADDNGGSDFDATTDSLRVLQQALTPNLAVAGSGWSGSLAVGVAVSGDPTALDDDDDSYYVLKPASPAVDGYGLNLRLILGVTGRMPSLLRVRGYWSGVGETCEVWAYDWRADAWDQLSTADTVMTTDNQDRQYRYVLRPQHVGVAGTVWIEFRSTSTTDANRLNLDQVTLYAVDAQPSAGEAAALGVSLSASDLTSIATAVWDAGSRTLTSFGTLVADIWANATRTLSDYGTLTTDTATAVWANGTRTLSSFGTLAADTATAVWAAGTRTLTSFGTLASDVWANGTRTLSSFGTLTTDAATAVWDALLAGITTAGSVGKLIKDNLDAAISTRATATDQTTVLDRLGAITGTGVNTVLGFFKAIAGKSATLPSDLGGTFSPTTDSLEAIRDQGDAAWVTGAGGGGGAGAYTTTITVTDGTNPLEGAYVRVKQGVETYVVQTNASGEAVFHLDAYTWALTATKPGYTYAGTDLVVDEEGETASIVMTEVGLAVPDAPTYTTAYLTTYDQAGNTEAGVKITIQLTAAPGAEAGQSFDDAGADYYSNASGYLEIRLLRNATYTAKRGDSTTETSFTTTDTDTYALPVILGHP